MNKINITSVRKTQLFTGIILGLILSVVTIQRASAISSTGWTVSGQNTNFDGTGNVGIGTSNPQGKLNINGGERAALKIDNNSIYGSGLTLNNQEAGGHAISIFSGGSANDVGVGGLGIFDETAVAYRLTVSSNGQIKMGNNTASTGYQLLSLVSVDTVGTGLTLKSNDPSGRQFTLFSAGSGVGSNAGKLHIIDNSAAQYRFTLDGSGNVGVGTTSPSEKIEAGGGGNLSLRANDGSTEAGDILFKNGDGSLKSSIRSYSNGDMCIGNCN